MRRSDSEHNFEGVRFTRGANGIYTPITEDKNECTVRFPIPIEAKTDWRAVSIQALLGAATLFLLAETLVVATGQWHEMVETTKAAQRTADTADKTLKVSQRAWLVPVGAEMEGFENNRDFRIWQFVPNNGPTPAKNVTFDGTICRWIDEANRQKGRRCSHIPSDNKGILIRAGGGYKIPFHWEEVSNSMVIDQKTIDEIVWGTINVRVSGTVNYDDVFEHRHWVKFCSEYAWEEGRFMSCIGGIDMDKDPE